MLEAESEFHPRPLDLLTSYSALDPFLLPNIELGKLRELTDSDLPVGTLVGDEEVADHWIKDIVDHHLDKKDSVVIVDGTPGEGKSTFTLWLALEIRARLNEALGLEDRFEVSRDIIYRQSELEHRILQSERKHPSVVVADEAVLIGAQARSGMYDAGARLDRDLAVCRIHGVTLFLLAPSIWGLASSVRNRRARLWFHVEHRGLSTAFRLRGALSWTPPRDLPFTKAKKPWSNLRWGSLESDPIWSPYEAQKIEVTKRALHESEMESVRAEQKLGLAPPAWAAEWLKKKLSDEAPQETPRQRHNRLARESYHRRMRADAGAMPERARAPERSGA